MPSAVTGSRARRSSRSWPRMWRATSRTTFRSTGGSYAKHLGLVLAVFAASLTLTILHDVMTTPLYTASSTVLIRANQPPLLENATVTIVSQGSQFDSGGEDQTQIELLKSRALAARVVAAEGLATDPSFVGKPTVGPIGMLRDEVVQWVRSKIGVPAPAVKGTATSPANEQSGLAAPTSPN